MDFDKDIIKKTTHEVASTVFNSTDNGPHVQKYYMSKNKSKKFWIWIFVVITIIVLLGTIGGYHIIKDSNDRIAANYKSSLAMYLNDIHDIASASSSGPSEISYNVSKIKSPELVEVYFDGYSPDYDRAKTIEEEAQKLTSLLMLKIADCVSVYDFYNQWKNIENRLMEISNTSNPVASTYEDFRMTLSLFVSLLDNTAMPEELVSYNEELKLSAQKLYNSWSSLFVAYGAGDQVAYNAAYSEYENNIRLVESSVKPYKIYYDNLSSKVKLAADDVKIYAESIK